MLKHTPAVILGLGDTGYGTARSLAMHDIPIIAFEKDSTRPETHTRLCEQIHAYQSEEDLLEQLLSLFASIETPPVIYASGDMLVDFINRNRDRILPHSRIDFPSTQTVNELLEKTKFTKLATEHGFQIPQTIIIDESYDAQPRMDVTFPCIIKPTWRSENWKRAKLPKVIRMKDEKELHAGLPEIRKIEANLVVQEWIPGPDSSIYFCLAYFDNDSKCLGSFTGRKLRQWPIGVGSTACAEPAIAPEVTSETIRLFELARFKGFGSVEFKQHVETGQYYIMEPTVGRCNHQSFIATANGLNLPFVAYCSLTGQPIPASTRQKETVWIDDQFDGLSILANMFRGRLELLNLFRSYFSRKSFRFLNLRDPAPLLHVWLQAPLKLSKYLKRAISR